LWRRRPESRLVLAFDRKFNGKNSAIPVLTVFYTWRTPILSVFEQFGRALPDEA
jgi:hypothetical protein